PRIRYPNVAQDGSDRLLIRPEHIEPCHENLEKRIPRGRIGFPFWRSPQHLVVNRLGEGSENFALARELLLQIHKRYARRFCNVEKRYLSPGTLGREVQGCGNDSASQC